MVEQTWKIEVTEDMANQIRSLDEADLDKELRFAIHALDTNHEATITWLISVLFEHLVRYHA